MKFVTSMGAIYQLTDAKYKKMVEYIAAGATDLDLEKFGKLLGYVDRNVTDLTEDLMMECRMECPGYPEYAEYQKAKARLQGEAA